MTVSLRDLFTSLFFYTHGKLENGRMLLPNSAIFETVPEFQRSNDKWTQDMQIKFVENVLMGYRTTIMLFEIGDTTMTECQILDGLQRLTAFYRFLEGEIKAFGRTFEQLRDLKIIQQRQPYITVRVYTFQSLFEAIDFYISMNENITHSSDDIQKAKRYLQSQSS